MQSGERIVINGRDYRLGPVLSTGAGSYGQVWAATDSAGRAVALKFINAEAMSQADASLHGHWRAHLEREIAFLAGPDAARSRHVVTLIDHGQVDDQPVLVVERLQANLGQWLAQRRRDGESPPDLARILDWTEQILDGLDVIHGAGFVYRDLKFSNILVGDQGELLKLADFGSLKRENGDSTRSCIGTPATMAPEQILPIRHGADGCEYAVDYRADFYALGLLLFALLTEQPTTAAQRRLGQLLAFHGQEGAGQHRDQLGGLTDDERELLRRSIEFWTVPVRPEQEQRGAARLLGDLLGRLLARDPAARPASSAEIRAVLDAVRTDQPAVPPVSPDGLAPPPAVPPNRHPRRAASAAGSPWPRRAVGLAGMLGLAGALAWAVIVQPGFRHDRAEAPSTVLAPPPADLAAQPTPATESVAPANATPDIAATPPTAESPIPPELSAEEAGADATDRSAEATGRDPTTETPAATPAEIAAEPQSPVEPSGEPVAKPENESTTDAPALADSPSEIEPTERPATTAPPKIDATSRQSSRAPAVVERSTPASTPARAATKPSREKAAKATPPAAGTVAKSAKAAPSVAEPPAVSAPAAVPTKAPPAAKAAPKPPAPAAPTVARHAPPAKKTASSVRRKDNASGRLARASTPPKAATSPAPAPRTARAASRSVDLPPIQLVSGNSGGSKAAPPPAAQPAITLVSRSEPAPAMAPVRPAPAAPPRNSAAKPSKPPARSADPITAFQKDVGRAAGDIRREAESIGNWMGRTSNSVGTEIQRGLDSANRAVNNWTGNCTGAGCQPARRVERRDRWSGRSGENTASRSRPTAPADEAPSGLPPRRPQEYR